MKTSLLFLIKNVFSLKNIVLMLSVISFSFIYGLNKLEELERNPFEFYLNGAARAYMSLIKAVSQGNNVEAKRLIKLGVNVNNSDINRWTALHWAVSKGNEEIVQELLKANAKCEAFDKYRLTPLMRMLGRNTHAPYNINITKLLIASSSNVDTADIDGWTPLLLAAAHGDEEIVKLLIDANANVDLANNNGFSALYLAAEKGYVNIVKYLIAAKANINLIIPDSGYTPLIAASYHGHEDIVQELIKAGADVNVTDKQGNNALSWAIEKRRLKCASLLITAGIDIQNKKEESIHCNELLIDSVCCEDVEMVDKLLSIKADVNYSADAAAINLTPLRIASCTGNAEILKKLLESKADVNASDDHGTSALMDASWKGHDECVAELLSANADVDAKNEAGETAVLAAAIANNTKSLQRLIDARADVNTDSDVASPLTALVKHKNLKAVKALIEAKADVNKTDKEISALRCAVSQGFSQGVKELIQAGANVETDLWKEAAKACDPASLQLLVTEEYVSARKFHERLKEIHADWFSENVKAYYKKINTSARSETSNKPTFNLKSVKISGKKIIADSTGKYNHNGLSFTLGDFDQKSELIIDVSYEDEPVSVCCTLDSEEKKLSMHRFDSLQELLVATRENKISCIHKIVIRCEVCVPDESPLIIMVEYEQSEQPTLQGMEIACNKERATTRLFFDFVDTANELIDPEFYIEFRQSYVKCDRDVFCLKNNRLFNCVGKKVYMLFDSLETRKKWILNECDFYDFDRDNITSLPGCYSDPKDSSETLVQSIVWVFSDEQDAFYKLSDESKQFGENKYIYSSEGKLFAAPHMVKQGQEFLANKDKVNFEYLGKLPIPVLSLDKKLVIDGGHRDWPTGVYERIDNGDHTVWQRLGEPSLDPILIRNKIDDQDGFSSAWPDTEKITKKDVEQWCDFAQTFFTKNFHAKFSADAWSTVDGYSINDRFKDWTKLTSLDLSNIRFSGDWRNDNKSWANIFKGISTLTQLTLLSFSNNYLNYYGYHCYETHGVRDPETEKVLNASIYWINDFVKCLSKLNKLEYLFIQGMWLLPHNKLGECHIYSHKVSSEMINLIENIYDYGKAILHIVKAIAQMPSLKELRIDGINRHSPRSWDNASGIKQFFSVLFVAPIVVEAVGSERQFQFFKEFYKKIANEIIKARSLRYVYIYTPGWNYDNYFGYDIRTFLSESKPSLYVFPNYLL